jgi:A/G-specific adenine glycosylase
MKNTPALLGSAAKTAAYRGALLCWYDANRRELPWRKTRDPYRVWVSEIMLQQTRVAAVLEHYKIFLERFPDVRALASAAESAVLAVWSGLGYYRRARMMHLCAKKIVSEHAAKFPETSAALRELPGIGRYTAAAIASIAFSENTAVVDGNVERVLGRLSGKQLTSEENWEGAQRLLDFARPGDFNQATMELGATTCLPRQPACLTCPVRKWCATRGELLQETKSPRQQKREIWCALDRRDGHVRLVRRSQRESLMAGMWELPHWPAPDESGRARWRTFKHSITVTDYTVHVVRGTPPIPEGKWVSIARIPAIPITGLTRKILRADGII